MALILHLETATTVCSVALANEGKLLASKEENKGFTHAEHLTIFIQEVMQQAGKSLHELDAVAVSKGPGSYTGLRIGVATAKGLCYGLNKPLLSVNTLAALAKGASLKHSSIHMFCPMLDARRMEVYAAVFDGSLQVIKPTEAVILTSDSYAALLEQNEILFFGDGAHKFQELTRHANAKFDPEILPGAINMIELAYGSFLTKSFEDVAYFEPFYLKEFYSPASKVKE